MVPCYNEQDVLPASGRQLVGKLESLVEDGRIQAGSFVLFVDDSSTDTTWNIVSKLSAQHPLCEGLKLSRNQGHQNALLAGLMQVRHSCDAAISIDCDGQDDIDAIDDMIEAYRQGFDIVYGVRSNRATDTAFKRTTAVLFYKLMGVLGAETVHNHADFRLMSARSLDALSRFDEVNLYLRGLVPLVGYPSTTVEYVRHQRLAGETHYPVGKMANLAVSGITSLSTKPIHLVSLTGLAISCISFVDIIATIVLRLAGSTVVGWASMVCVMLLLGGLQLLALGVIGEYVGRIYLEVKRRPRYIVEECTLEES